MWVCVDVYDVSWVVQRTKQTLTYIHRNNMIQQFIYSWICVCVCVCNCVCTLLLIVPSHCYMMPL